MTFVDEAVGFLQALPVTLWLALLLLSVFVAIVRYLFPKRPGPSNGEGPTTALAPGNRAEFDRPEVLSIHPASTQLGWFRSASHSSK